MASYEQKHYEDARLENRQYLRQLVKIVLLGFFYFIGFHGLATFIALVWIAKVAIRTRKRARYNNQSPAERHTDFLMSR